MFEVSAHRFRCGCGLAGEDGFENFGVVGDGLVLGDESVAVAEACLQKVGQGLQKERGNFVSGGFSDAAVELHVGENLGLKVLTVLEALMSGLQLFQIGCVGSLSGEASVFRFEGEADFGELDEALSFIGHEHVYGAAKWLVKLVHHRHPAALADLQEALKFQPFRGFAHDTATDAQLGGKVALGGQTTGGLILSSDGDDSLTNSFNEGRGTIQRGKHEKL